MLAALSTLTVLPTATQVCDSVEVNGLHWSRALWVRRAEVRSRGYCTRCVSWVDNCHRVHSRSTWSTNSCSSSCVAPETEQQALSMPMHSLPAVVLNSRCSSTSMQPLGGEMAASAGQPGQDIQDRTRAAWLTPPPQPLPVSLWYECLQFMFTGIPVVFLNHSQPQRHFPQ